MLGARVLDDFIAGDIYGHDRHDRYICGIPLRFVCMCRVCACVCVYACVCVLVDRWADDTRSTPWSTE